MKRFAFIALLLSLLLAFGAFAEEAGPTLLFEDNFDGAELSDNWSYMEFNRGSSCYWTRDNAFLDGEGNLIIYAMWDAENYMVASSGIRTVDSFQGGYGYYEVRAKVCNYSGAISFFNITAGNMGDVTDGAANGVDIYVIKANRPNTKQVSHSFDWDGWGAEHKSQSVEYSAANVYDGNFHTFGVLRHEGGYTFYIDRKVMWNVSSNVVEACPLNGYLNLSLEFQPYAGFQPGAEEALIKAPGEYVIDYVRVWDGLPF